MSGGTGKIRLLAVCGSCPPVLDGVGDYCQNLYHRLARKGETEILVLTDAAAAGQKLPGLEVRPLVQSWSLWGLPKLLKACREYRPDLIHIQYPSINFKRHLMPNLLPLFMKRAGPVIVTLHGFGLYTWLGKLRLTLAAVPADGIIPVSEHIRSSAQKFWRGPGRYIADRLEQVVFIGSNIDPAPDVTSEMRKAVREAWGLEKGELALAFFGFINDGKGFDDLLQAFRICLDQGLKARLVILSRLDPQRDSYHLKMQGLMDKLGLEQALHFTGYLDPKEVALALASADLAVLPFNYGASTKRGTMLAALACGCPVVTTADSSLPDFFKNGENIVLVPPKEPTKLAEAIMKAGTDQGLRERLRLGTSELSRHFDWDSITEKHLEIYRRYLKNGEEKK